MGKRDQKRAAAGRLFRSSTLLTKAQSTKVRKQEAEDRATKLLARSPKQRTPPSGKISDAELANKLGIEPSAVEETTAEVPETIARRISRLKNASETPQ